MDDLVQTAKSLWGLWLMLIFIGIVAWVMWPGRKREMDDHARIPFDDPLDEPRSPLNEPVTPLDEPPTPRREPERK